MGAIVNKIEWGRVGGVRNWGGKGEVQVNRFEQV